MFTLLFSFPKQNPKNRRRHSRKADLDSDESDSDQDPLTSSRTESSNQLDGKMKHSNSSSSFDIFKWFFDDLGFPLFLSCAHFSAGIIYHGNQSSTSSDLSPMSEQKSLPRRGRSRYHQQNNPTYTTNTTPRHKKSPSPAIVTASPLLSTATPKPIKLAQKPNLLVASSPSRSSHTNNANYYSRMSSQFKPIHRTITNTSSIITPSQLQQQQHQEHLLHHHQKQLQ